MKCHHTVMKGIPVCVCICAYLPIFWAQIGTQKWAKPDKITHTQKKKKKKKTLRTSSFVKLCVLPFVNTQQDTRERNWSVIDQRCIRRRETDGIKYSILHHITPLDTVYRSITMVETAHYYNSSEKCSYSVDSVICHTALTVNSV